MYFDQVMAVILLSVGSYLIVDGVWPHHPAEIVPGIALICTVLGRALGSVIRP